MRLKFNLSSKYFAFNLRFTSVTYKFLIKYFFLNLFEMIRDTLSNIHFVKS